MQEYVEIWKPIIGYEGFYSISNFGRVRRDCGGAANTHAGFMRKGNKSNRYVEINLSKYGVSKKYRTHALVAIHFIGPRPVGMEINHIDGNKYNNFVKNLEYVSPKENMAHAQKSGLLRCAFGEKQGSSKLKENEVNEIRIKYKLGNYTQKLLAKEYGISSANIRHIVGNRSWKHLLTGNPEFSGSQN
jgi:hypothetical protein